MNGHGNADWNETPDTNPDDSLVLADPAVLLGPQMAGSGLVAANLTWPAGTHAVSVYTEAHLPAHLADPGRAWQSQGHTHPPISRDRASGLPPGQPSCVGSGVRSTPSATHSGSFVTSLEGRHDAP